MPESGTNLIIAALIFAGCAAMAHAVWRGRHDRADIQALLQQKLAVVLVIYMGTALWGCHFELVPRDGSPWSLGLPPGLLVGAILIGAAESWLMVRYFNHLLLKDAWISAVLVGFLGILFTVGHLQLLNGLCDFSAPKHHIVEVLEMQYYPPGERSAERFELICTDWEKPGGVIRQDVSEEVFDRARRHSPLFIEAGGGALGCEWVRNLKIS